MSGWSICKFKLSIHSEVRSAINLGFKCAVKSTITGCYSQISSVWKPLNLDQFSPRWIYAIRKHHKCELNRFLRADYQFMERSIHLVDLYSWTFRGICVPFPLFSPIVAKHMLSLDFKSHQSFPIETSLKSASRVVHKALSFSICEPSQE